MLPYYKLKYYINASHSFMYEPEKAHAHTFAVTLYIEVSQDDFVAFYELDQRLNRYFEKYAGKYLNDLPEFQLCDPTLENMGDFFYEDLRERLWSKGLHLMQLDISETPVRIYSISDQALATSSGNADINDRWETLLQDKKQFLQDRI